MALKKKKRKKKTRPLTRSERTVLVRKRLLQEAKREGVISNERACEIGELQQSWYHLNALVEAKKLKRAGYNQWMPTGRR